MSQLADKSPEGDPVVYLLHDAAEAFVGDIVTPQKHRMWWDNGNNLIHFKTYELRLLAVIGDALGVDDLAERAEDEETKQADQIMLATEVRDLMPPQRWELFTQWMGGAAPLEEKIKSSLRFAPVPPHRRSMYLRVFEPFVGIPVRNLVHVIRSGPLPQVASASAHQVYFWRILKYCSYESTFIPEDEYPELCETGI